MQDIFPSKILKTRFLIIKIKLETKHSADFLHQIKSKDPRPSANEQHGFTILQLTLRFSSAEAGNTTAAAHL